MFSEVIVAFLLSVFAQDITYYVASNGTDSSTCGAEEIPCASLNQVLKNYRYNSYTVSITAGIYKTSNMAISDNNFVVFQGAGNPTIVGTWDSGIFVAISDTSGYEFHDLILSLFGDGDYFTIMYDNGGTVGFYNVSMTLASNKYQYVYADFIRVHGGSLIMNNLTFSQCILNAFFIMDEGTEINATGAITITGSNFFNNTFLGESALLEFNANGTANVSIDSTIFAGNTGQHEFICFISHDNNQIFIMSNNIFNNTSSYLPSVSVQNAYFVQHDQELTIIQNTTWINCSGVFDSAALEVVGSDSDDIYDCKTILNNLTFTNCVGDRAGALFVYCNSLILFNSTFENNTAGVGGYANDVVQDLNDNTAGFKCDITNSYSSSVLPKAVIRNFSSNTTTDISDKLPNRSRSSPKFGRKNRKY